MKRIIGRRRDYSDLASGHVLRGAPGLPAFPVRLAVDMFHKAIADRPENTTVAILDPCCGAGYLLTILGIIFAARISVLMGLDPDAKAVEFAKKNLSLLAEGGLERRRKELEQLRDVYGRDSHFAAVESARALEAERANAVAPKVLTGVADSTSVASVREAVGAQMFDVALCDLPYGNMVKWEGDAASLSPVQALNRLLLATMPSMKVGGIWVIVAPKNHLPTELPVGFKRHGRLRSGHREVLFIRQE